jgi:uncharacterized membrane protein YphA (DoxX/SURF4 family)
MPAEVPMELLPEPPADRSPPTSAERAIASIRVGLGIVWTLNLVFILDPANQFFPGFSATAQSFGSTSIGGPGLANFVAGHSGLFSVMIAATTAYLALALLTGTTTRLACLVGFVFNSFLLVTQFGTIVVVPGGTDVGPMPLYLVMYLGLLAAGGPTLLSVDRWWADRHVSHDGARRPVPLGALRRASRPESYPVRQLGR